MARRKNSEPPEATATAPSEAWQAALDTSRAIGGVPGPGRWLVVGYLPTALFSLKASTATSSVGKTLLVPTGYAIKMALVDAAFRAGLADEVCADLVRSLARVDRRISPPAYAVVTHTFVKIRQESRDADPLRPYGPSIAYREFVYYQGLWRWAFDLAHVDEQAAQRIAFLAPRVNYVGKRGSFVQFTGVRRIVDLSAEFTLPMPQPGGEPMTTMRLPRRWHGAILDDFGPEADLAVLSSFSSAKISRERHRRFVHTLVPLGLVSSGPGFSYYEA